MSLKERISEDMKAAMRAKDAETLGTIRMLQAAIKQREVDERITLDDSQVMSVLEKMIKTRKEAFEQFKAGARDDLADKEAREIVQLKVYLPEQMAASELEEVIAAAIASVGASSIKDMGKVMAIVKQQAAGRADMTAVSAAIKAKLG